MVLHKEQYRINGFKIAVLNPASLIFDIPVFMEIHLIKQIWPKYLPL